MYVKDTNYRLAVGSGDYKKVRQFLTNHDREFTRLSFPTIIAERDKNIVGVLPTTHSQQAVIAGPLHIDVGDGNPSFVLIRLWQSYERVLAQAGVSEYFFWIAEEQGSWLTAIQQMQIEPYTRENGRVWFRREVEWAADQTSISPDRHLRN